MCYDYISGTFQPHGGWNTVLQPPRLHVCCLASIPYGLEFKIQTMLPDNSEQKNICGKNIYFEA